MDSLQRAYLVLNVAQVDRGLQRTKRKAVTFDAFRLHLLRSSHGIHMGRLRAVLGSCGAVLGALLGRLEASLGRLGALLGSSWLSGGLLGPSGGRP